MPRLSAISSRFSSLRGHRDAFFSTACLIQLFRLTPCAVAERGALVQVGAEPRVEGAGERLLRFDPVFAARREVLVDRSPELAPDPVDVGRLERRDGVGPAVDGPAVKTADGVVELDGGHVALVLHHGFTPAASRKAVTARTVPRL